MTPEELYVEVNHMRGNFNKFEYLVHGQWTEVSVWTLRQCPPQHWRQFFEVTEGWRVEHYPSIEEDTFDEPYTGKPEDNWKIDLEKVRENI